MKTDPRKACANEREKWVWAWVHDAIAHPLMAFTNWSKVSLRFHDYTSYRAWPRANEFQEIEVWSPKYGNVVVIKSAIEGLWQVMHPRMGHAFGTKANDALEAVEQAEQWFDSLAVDGYGV